MRNVILLSLAHFRHVDLNSSLRFAWCLWIHKIRTALRCSDFLFK
jgi:hypothetical protein